MKKQLLTLGFAALSVLAVAQTTRMSLYEEFTGENCGPCASTNPGLNTLLLANLSKVIPIKWQVDIPSAPTNTWSLWQTNQTEISWRAYTYGYGISSAPNARIDGQAQTAFGASSNNPGSLSQTHLNNASAVPAPFSISMQRAWDGPMSVFTVTVSITAAQTFTCAGPLRFRLVMVEKEIHFATAPGTNGEKDFYYTARKSFPTIQNGTSLPTSWTAGQNQTFTIACTAPSYIVTKSEVECVGFIQDDATRRVHQAGVTKAPNDAANNGLVSPFYSCSTTHTPSIKVTNAGVNTISSLTITPVLDGVAGTPFAWAGSIAPATTATVTMPAVSTIVGNHTYTTNITGVNGGVDDYPGNNTNRGSFAVSTTVTAAPIIQTFSLSTFPPLNWYRNNQDNGTFQFSRIPTVGAYAVIPLGAVKYDSWNNPNVGDRDELYMPHANFTGMTNMKLTFDVAHAMVATSVIEGLDVMISTNCGVTWTNVYSKYGSVLASAPVTTVAFTPSASQWRSEVVNLGAYDNLPNVLVKFVPYNSYGNNIWLDNINLISTTDVSSISTSFDGVDLYPNPAQNETTVRITSSKSEQVTVNLVNTLGQSILQKGFTLEFGVNNVMFDTQDLASGIYYVVVSNNDKKTVKKLIINK